MMSDVMKVETRGRLRVRTLQSCTWLKCVCVGVGGGSSTYFLTGIRPSGLSCSFSRVYLCGAECTDTCTISNSSM